MEIILDKTSLGLQFSVLSSVYTRLPQLNVMKCHMAKWVRNNAPLIAILGEGYKGSGCPPPLLKICVLQGALFAKWCLTKFVRPNKSLLVFSACWVLLERKKNNYFFLFIFLFFHFFARHSKPRHATIWGSLVYPHQMDLWGHCSHSWLWRLLVYQPDKQ